MTVQEEIRMAEVIARHAEVGREMSNALETFVADEPGTTEPNAVETSEYVEITPTRLIFSDDTPWGVYEAVLGRLEESRRSLMWWIGDALAFGESKYGETYTQAVEATGYSVETVKQAASVAKRVEPCIRIHDLTWGNHQVVASLDPEDQRRWLEAAKPEPGSDHPKLSVSKLREAIKDERMAPWAREARRQRRAEKGCSYCSGVPDGCDYCNGTGRLPRDETHEEMAQRHWRVLERRTREIAEAIQYAGHCAEALRRVPGRELGHWSDPKTLAQAMRGTGEALIAFAEEQKEGRS